MTDTASAAPEFDTAAATGPAASSAARQWLAPAWFLLGVLVGILGFAAYARLTTAPPVATPDVVAIREAARVGTLDAIATSTPMAVKTAVAANQIGAPNAPVTIVEFSDFQ